MADTIITNTRRAEDTGEGTMMNVILAVIFVAIAVGLVVMFQNGVFQAAPVGQDTGRDINVTIPSQNSGSDPAPTPTPAPTPAPTPTPTPTPAPTPTP